MYLDKCFYVWVIILYLNFMDSNKCLQYDNKLLTKIQKDSQKVQFWQIKEALYKTH